MQAHQHGTPMLASSGYVAQVDESLCAGCGECEEHCQFAAITVTNGLSTVNFTECMGCGICVSHCPQGALELVLAPEKGIPLEMSKILG
jgi:heterodisulfide reductase subunit A-like polyferredoxin